MSLSKQSLLSRVSKPKRRVKYLIVTSSDGTVYGAFTPDKREDAEGYVETLQRKTPGVVFEIHPVSNLNQFYASLKYGKQRAKTVA